MSDLRMTHLFRQRAVDHVVRRLEGEVILATPASLVWVNFAVFLVVAAIVCFVSTVQYSRRITASGWLVPRDGQVEVVSPVVGHVDSIVAMKGDTVDAGNTLLTVVSQVDQSALVESRGLLAGTRPNSGGQDTIETGRDSAAPPVLSTSKSGPAQLTAPIRGTVIAIDPSPDRFIAAGDAFAILIRDRDKGSDLVGEVFVGRDEIVKVKAGQPVDLSLLSPGAGTAKSVHGTIESVAAVPSSLRGNLLPSQRERDPLYRIRISLEKRTSAGGDGDLRQFSGAPVTGTITIGKFSLLEWIMRGFSSDVKVR